MLWKRILVNLGIGLLVGSLFLAANEKMPVFKQAELMLYNARFETFRGRRPAPEDVVILAMDEASLEEVGPYPWRRDVHARVADKLINLGAKLVAFDIMFLTESQFPEADAELKQTLAKHKDQIVVVSKIEFGSTSRISGSGTGGGNQDGAVELSEAGSYSPPIFEDSATFGFANVDEGMVDSQIRRAQIVYNIEADQLLPTPMTLRKKYEPHFTLSMLRLLDPKKADALIDKYAEKSLWINFAGPPQSFKTLSYYIVHKLGQPGFDKNSFEELVGQRAEDYFKNKIVMIGASAEVLQDNKNTPFVSVGSTKMPGVEVHANLFDTLRQDIPYEQAPNGLNTLLILAFSVITAIALSFLGPLGGLALVIALMAGYAITNVYFFNFQRLFIDLFAPLMAMIGSYTVSYAYRYLIEEREKRRIRKFFKSYVSPKLVEELLKDPSTMPSLKSERRMVSILFSDIAGFTSMSESLPPDEVEHILNEYLTAMSEIVFTNDGTLDKYIGDAVMAIWGNVGSSNPKTDAYKAVHTAILMQRKLAELREKWLSEGMVPLQIRIGVNTGEALVGNFGSPQKMDYTVIGDAVNTAARLEGLNKEFNSSILISQSSYDLVKDRVNARHCGNAKVKGKEETVSVFEVMGWKDEAGAATEIRDTKWIKGTQETQWK
jgi:adenylate cyclase